MSDNFTWRDRSAEDDDEATSEADEEADENAAGKFRKAEVIFVWCRAPKANTMMIKRPNVQVDTIMHFRLCFGDGASEK